MNQSLPPDPSGSDATGADRDQLRLAAFLAGEWSPQDAAQCADLVAAWHAQQAKGEHDLPSLLDLTADLDALGLSDSMAGDQPDWVHEFDAEAALKRARKLHLAGSRAEGAGIRPVRWRRLALAAAAVFVALVGIRLGARKASSTGVQQPEIPVFGEAQAAGNLALVAEPDGQRRLVAQDLPEELDDVRRWLRVEIQTERKEQVWVEIYSGELGPNGFLIGTGAGVTPGTRLRWRGNIQVPGELDARWSSDWRYSD